MKDLYVITHQHGEGAKLRYYCSLQNNLGDVLAETNEYTTPDGCKSAVEELLPMLRGYAQSRMMGEACILGKYYYHRLLVNNIPVLRTRTCSSRAAAVINTLWALRPAAMRGVLPCERA